MERLKHINSKNWNYTGYTNGDFKAIIGMFAIPDAPDTAGYTVTVLENELKEISNQDFESLNAATQHINQKFSHWDFLDLKEKQSGGSGCDSCTAH